VILEAVDDGDVNEWLNPDLLRRVWRDLGLPPRHLALWESRLPELADCGSD
jgi:hypothetical protein